MTTEWCFCQTTPWKFNVDIPIYHNFSKGVTIFSTPPPLEQAWNPKTWWLVDVSPFLRVSFFRELPLLETNISPTSRHFWVDDFPNFPLGGILVIVLVKGTIFSIHASKNSKGKTSRFGGFLPALHRKSIQGSAVSASAGVEYLPVTAACALLLGGWLPPWRAPWRG